ncbi:MAG: PAS domain S-box protein, partial [Bacteroidota bacterium]
MKSKSEILRQQAEAILQKNPSRQVSLTEGEMLKLVHELEVHQIELQLLLETTGEELSFEIREKAKLADELLIANQELAFKNNEKSDLANELGIANIELQFQNNEKEKWADELTHANKLISIQRDRLEEIASLVPGVVYQYRLRPDGSSCFPYASDAINHIYRVTPDEVRLDAGKVFANIHPDDHAEVVNSIHTSAKELSPWQHEYRVKFDDGTIRILFGNALPQREVGGSVLWHGFITDITESKLARKQLQDSEARYSSMISNISDVIGIMGADGNMTYKSANIEKFFGWFPEERIGTSGFATIHPDDIPKVQNVFSSLLGEDNSVKTLEFRYQCKDGSYKPIELTASNQLNNPAINGVLLNYRDISDRKIIEANLEEISEKYRGLSEASFEAIFISEKGVCIEQNLAAELMFGYTSEEALTRYGTDWIVPEDREMVMNNILSGIQEPY